MKADTHYNSLFLVALTLNIMIHSIEEMIAIVQIYIHHRKGKEVQIQINSAIDILLLTRAHSIALNWLNNNGFKQI